MARKGLNLFDECAASCVYLFPQEEERTSAPLLPKETVKCTHLIP